MTMELGVTEPAEDVAEVLQEQPGPSIPVRIEGYVGTHELPSKRTNVDSVFVPLPASGFGGWTQILSGSPKRKRVVLLSRDNNFRFSFTGMENPGTAGGYWPINVPLEITNQLPIFAASMSGAGSMITVMVDFWAD